LSSAVPDKTLSVIMPNYNHGQLIGTALEAILNQSFKPLEVIVIDDASTDNSVDVIQEFARRDTNVRLFRNERNMGVVFTANKGFGYASGEYVYFASADDRILPGFFEKSMNLLTRYPQAGLCCSNPIIFESKTGVINRKPLFLSNSARYFTPAELIKLARRTNISIWGQTVITKRSAFKEVGGLIPQLKWYSDWFCNYVISFRYGMCYIPEFLTSARVHQNCYSASGAKQPSEQKKIIQYIISLLESSAFNDVFDSFKRTGILSTFQLKILYMILKNPKYWNLLSLLLIRRAFWYEAVGTVVPVTPEAVKRIYRRLREKKWESTVSC
jgi:glycosyltransferase involved in cell wall biosynthesis